MLMVPLIIHENAFSPSCVGIKCLCCNFCLQFFLLVNWMYVLF